MFYLNEHINDLIVLTCKFYFTSDDEFLPNKTKLRTSIFVSTQCE